MLHDSCVNVIGQGAPEKKSRALVRTGDSGRSAVLAILFLRIIGS